MKDMPFNSGEKKLGLRCLVLPCGGSPQTNVFPVCFHIQQLNGQDERHRCKTVSEKTSFSLSATEEK